MHHTALNHLVPSQISILFNQKVKIEKLKKHNSSRPEEINQKHRPDTHCRHYLY